MATLEQNELLCRVGPGTGMGSVFRRFWHPVCTIGQLPTPDCAPLRVRILGENYVAFRDSKGRVGVLDEGCMHRGASLALGRVEDCGIRCIYHGWKFAVDGKVLAVPNHPDPDYIARQRANAYSVREAGGLVWAYLGPSELEPPFPHYPFFDFPEENVFPVRFNLQSNYLQNLEGGLDSSHTTMLHTDYIRPSWRDGAPKDAMANAAPAIEVEDTSFGYHYAAIRHFTDETGERRDNIRIMPFIMPYARIIPGRRGKSFGGQSDTHADLFVFEVPADDENTSTFLVIYSPRPVNRQAALIRLGLDDPAVWSETDPDLKLSMDDLFGQDRAAMANSWTGLGGGIVVEDAAVICSMGRIFDRSKEHLVPADRALVRARRILLESAKRVADGGDPIGLDVDCSKVSAFDGVMPDLDHWRELVPGHVVRNTDAKTV